MPNLPGSGTEQGEDKTDNERFMLIGRPEERSFGNMKDNISDFSKVLAPAIRQVEVRRPKPLADGMGSVLMIKQQRTLPAAKGATAQLVCLPVLQS